MCQFGLKSAETDGEANDQTSVKPKFKVSNTFN